MAKNFDLIAKTQGYYESNAKLFYDGTVSIDMKDLYKPFFELIPSRGAILDAGCGSGRDSKNFIAQGYRVVAFDASQELAGLASALIGQPVLSLSFSDLRFDNQFDGIWACASLVHVLKADMSRTLSRLTKALRHGGILYASFKHGNSELVRDGRHFSDYDENSFNELLAGHPDLTLVRYWQTRGRKQNSSHGTWLNVLVRKE